VLHGPEGYGRLHGEDGFLYHHGIADLVLNILNPPNLINYALTPASRIEALPDMLRRTVLGDSTFRDLRYGWRGAPLLVLNSADMATGERFSFTQEQLDRLCLDLRDVRLADATAASAAFPVALTPLPLPVRSPCPAQAAPPAADIMQGFFAQAALDEERAAYGPGCDGRRPVPDAPALFRNQPQDLPRGLRQWHLLNLDVCGRPLPEDRRVRFVHLLDGGTADNLALAAPLETITGFGADSRVPLALSAGRVQEVVIVSVNARSQGALRIGRDGSTPGMISMALAAIDTPIDGRSGGLLAELGAAQSVLRGRFLEQGRQPPRVRVLAIDFERIADAECRSAFQGIATSWTLPRQEVDALQEMGAAMLRADPRYLELAGQARPDPGPGQARARAACERLRTRGAGGP
jgi:NTE family protein